MSLRGGFTARRGGDPTLIGLATVRSPMREEGGGGDEDKGGDEDVGAGAADRVAPGGWVVTATLVDGAEQEAWWVCSSFRVVLPSSSSSSSLFAPGPSEAGVAGAGAGAGGAGAATADGCEAAVQVEVEGAVVVLGATMSSCNGVALPPSVPLLMTSPAAVAAAGDSTLFAEVATATATAVAAGASGAPAPRPPLATPTSSSKDNDEHENGVPAVAANPAATAPSSPAASAPAARATTPCSPAPTSTLPVVTRGHRITPPAAPDIPSEGEDNCGDSSFPAPSFPWHPGGASRVGCCCGSAGPDGGGTDGGSSGCALVVSGLLFVACGGWNCGNVEFGFRRKVKRTK